MDIQVGRKESEPNGEVKGAPAEILLHRDLSTNTQIGMLLAICGSMGQALVNMEPDATNVPQETPERTEAQLAAEVTFIKACDRLDGIIDDPRRWGTEYQFTLERQYNERHQKQLGAIEAEKRFSEQRTKTATEIATPHFRYRPALIPMEDGTWMAFLGRVDDMSTGIFGMGANPEAALESFDESFAGNLSPAVQEWLKTRETDLDDGITVVKPFPKEDPQDERAMDPDRGKSTSETDERGQVGAGDSNPS